MKRMVPLAILGLVGCASTRVEPAPSEVPVLAVVPVLGLAPVTDALCVTSGTATIGDMVSEPTMRAIARNTNGDAASLEFVYRGETAATRQLAGGQRRHQLGLKLRAQDSCNVVYVMWRLDPKSALEVSVKRNELATHHDECGADGYAKVKPSTKPRALPALEVGGRHALRAAIRGDELTAWIDDVVVWRGNLPASGLTLAGPAGLRSDNLAFDLLAFGAVASGGVQPSPKCSDDPSERPTL